MNEATHFIEQYRFNGGLKCLGFGGGHLSRVTFPTKQTTHSLPTIPVQ